MENTLLRAAADEGSPAISKQLQRYDWVTLALKIFVEEGIDAVRITRLADELQVSRGSFYWHFSNREDLIDALIRYWQSKNTPIIVTSLDNVETLEQGIFDFFEACVDDNLFDPRLDLAVREWARRSSKVRDLINDADETRIDAFKQFFLQFNYPEVEALIRARTIYYQQIGFYALDPGEPLEIRLQYTAEYFKCFTGKQADQTAVDIFNRRISNKFIRAN